MPPRVRGYLIEKHSGNNRCNVSNQWYEIYDYIYDTLHIWYDMIYDICDIYDTIYDICDVIYMIWWYDIYGIYLLSAVGLTPGGSSTVHIYTQTTYRTTQLTHRTTQLTTNREDRGPCPVLASYTLAFPLQLRKRHGKPSVKVTEVCKLARWKQNIQNNKNT